MEILNSEPIQQFLMKDIKERERLGMMDDLHEWVHEFIATLKYCAHVISSPGSVNSDDGFCYGINQFEAGVKIGRAILNGYTIISAKVGYNDGLDGQHCFYFIGRNEMDVAVKLALDLERALREDQAAAGILPPSLVP